MRRWPFLLLTLAAACAPSFPQRATATPIHEEISRVYSFKPHLLNQQQIEQESGRLDQFWAKARGQASVYVPALRQELTDFSNPKFFLFDGGRLLMSLSDTPVDRQIALTAFAHCDLRDVQARDYFLQVHRVAALGEGTTDAAFHILEDPKFQVFIPQHVLRLGQNYALVYMLLPTDPGYWLSAVVRRLQIERNETAQRSLLLVLWYAQTDEADKVLADFAADVTRPVAARKYARELLQRKVPADLVVTGSEASLRQERRERLGSVSDEALIDLDQKTAQLIRLRSGPGADSHAQAEANGVGKELQVREGLGKVHDAMPKNNAAIASDSLPVYAQMSTTQKPVLLLKKGDKVTVDFEINSAGQPWCHLAGTGFVSCNGLNRNP